MGAAVLRGRDRPARNIGGTLHPKAEREFDRQVAEMLNEWAFWFVVVALLSAGYGLGVILAQL